VFLYDVNDIWQVDLVNRAIPKNVTNGYGQKHNVEFHFACASEGSFVKDHVALLTAFDKNTKENGFYQKEFKKKGDPECLTKGPYTYYIPDNPYVPDDTHYAPVKAQVSDVYLVKRMSASEFPNYFFTSDFIHYYPLSNIHPQKKFNWLSSELLSWKTLDKKSSLGILYKPENFDRKKRYPVIIYYYDKLSDGLNAFPRPEFCHGDINIPYFVSNDYLIFTPDIQYKIGDPGWSAYNSIVSAAKYLSKFPFVDSTKIGISGHSFGGYETNFLVTHSNIFAAACSSSGFSDLISSYGGIWGSGNGWSEYLELRGGRIGGSLWDESKKYISNSPVFYAHKVCTPVLMMNNENDKAVSFSQGLEFFTALRRLGKRVWMLQYNNGRHSVSGENAKDFTIRTKQFFDHYLKDSACPRWMLYGIPASMKGIDNGYELVKEKDPKTGKWLTPKEGGLLTDEEKKKVEALKHRKPVTVTIE
jgi:hypothetical protein